jgi:RNA 2',3'-cyclic 3'-phosphodiesterase
VRWLEPGTWHLTLLFLGAVAAQRVPELVGLVDDTAHRCPPFVISIAGGGGRLRGADGVGWLHVHDGTDRVASIAESLAASCPAPANDAAPPKRTPSAHLTVARRLDRAALDALADQRHGPLDARWGVERMALLRSHLGSAGAHYETLHEATLYPREQ